MTELFSDIASLPENFEFHHLGYATTSIERERKLFAALCYRQEGAAFVDPLQGVLGCFLRGPGPCIELLENLPDSNTLTPWLNAGIKIYHFAYQVTSLDQALEWSGSHRAKVVAPPRPSVAFNENRISFVVFPNRLMLEFIERPEDQAQQMRM